MDGNPASLDMLAAAAAAATDTSGGSRGGKGANKSTPSNDSSSSVSAPNGTSVAVDPSLTALPAASTSGTTDLLIDTYLDNPLQGDEDRQRYDASQLGQVGSAALGQPFAGGPPQPAASPSQKRDRDQAKLDAPSHADPDARFLLVQPGTMTVAVPWHRHMYGKDLGSNPDGETRDRYHNAIKTMPWTKLETKSLKNEVLRLLTRQTQENFGAPADVNNIEWSEVIMHNDLRRRSAADCKMRYISHDHTGVNKGKWSKDELQRMYKIAEDSDMHNWPYIAAQLGTGRTPADCIKMFRARVVPKVAWTPEEDKKLKQSIRIFGENWQSIARAVGRHSNQCINRWTKTIRPHKKGKWTLEEDDELKRAVDACGPVWSRVAARVEGRSDAQCRERFSNVLDPNINRTEWKPEEDAIIMEQYAELGGQWGKIVQALKDQLPENGVRTDNKVMRRWDDLDKATRGKPLPKQRKRLYRNNMPRPPPVKGPRKGGRRRRGEDDSDNEEELNLDDESSEDEAQMSLHSDDDPDERPKKKRKTKKQAAAAKAKAKAAVPAARKAAPAPISVAGEDAVADAGEIAVDVAIEAPNAIEGEVEPSSQVVVGDEDPFVPAAEVAVTPTTTRSGRITKIRAGNL